MESSQLQVEGSQRAKTEMFAVCDRRDESRGASFIGSVVVQAIVVAIILVLGSRMTPKLAKQRRYVSLSYIAPIDLPPIRIHRPVVLPPLPHEAPARPASALAALKVLPPVPPPPPLAHVVMPAPPVAMKAIPAPVVPVVKPTPTAFEAKVNAPIAPRPVKVQLGDFGATETAASKPTSHVVNVAGFGAAEGTTDTKARGVVTTGGFGAAQSGTSTRNAGKVELTSFGGNTGANGAKRQPPIDEPTSTAVAILSKALPVYTDEARRLRIEGEVLVEVVFKANGSLQVVGVVKGLGHGLDEAAITAASKTRFSPSLLAGKPVDVHATLHIAFQLS